MKFEYLIILGLILVVAIGCIASGVVSDMSSAASDVASTMSTEAATELEEEKTTRELIDLLREMIESDRATDEKLLRMISELTSPDYGMLILGALIAIVSTAIMYVLVATIIIAVVLLMRRGRTKSQIQIPAPGVHGYLPESWSIVMEGVDVYSNEQTGSGR